MTRGLGARVYSGPDKEIGFKQLVLTQEGRASPLAAFGDAPVLHWHGDTFDLPTGATQLASTAVARTKGFSYGVYGFGPKTAACVASLETTLRPSGDGSNVTFIDATPDVAKKHNRFLEVARAQVARDTPPPV